EAMPDAPVCLEIHAGDKRIGQTVANCYREDLFAAGIGTGRHGFVFTPPQGLAFAPGTAPNSRRHTRWSGRSRGAAGRLGARPRAHSPACCAAFSTRRLVIGSPAGCRTSNSRTRR